MLLAGGYLAYKSAHNCGVTSDVRYSPPADWDCTSWEVPAVWRLPLCIQSDIHSLVDKKALQGPESPIPLLVEAGDTVLVVADSANTQCSAHG